MHNGLERDVILDAARAAQWNIQLMRFGMDAHRGEII
jgi:hypothetical protein